MRILGRLHPRTEICCSKNGATGSFRYPGDALNIVHRHMYERLNHSLDSERKSRNNLYALKHHAAHSLRCLESIDEKYHFDLVLKPGCSVSCHVLETNATQMGYYLYDWRTIISMLATLSDNRGLISLTLMVFPFDCTAEGFTTGKNVTFEGYLQVNPFVLQFAQHGFCSSPCRIDGSEKMPQEKGSVLDAYTSFCVSDRSSNQSGHAASQLGWFPW